MNTFLILTPVLAGIIALAYTIGTNLLRVWLNHRVKMALLERLQHDPAHVHSIDEVRAMTDHDATAHGALVDHMVLGATLAVIGLCSAFTAWLIGGGEWTTGVYFGGVICMAVGLILALLGGVVRYLEKLPADAPRTGPDRREH